MPVITAPIDAIKLNAGLPDLDISHLSNFVWRVGRVFSGPVSVNAKERIEDTGAGRLIKRLTNLDPEERGFLCMHEKSKWIATYEM
jgi:hypothetical protein